MPAEPTRYRSPDEDSARWQGFRFRHGDIVISTRSKSGTTWMQMLCALLVLGTDNLPRPLAELSPWLDWTVTPIEKVLTTLEAQTHRRFIKTHTPLDGIPFDPRATYIVVGRHPLDTAVSLYHQGDNLNRDRMAELTGSDNPANGDRRPDPASWLRAWIDWHGDPADRLDSLPGVMWHLGDAWAKRHLPNLIMVHYDDLLDDLSGQMATLAGGLGIDVGPGQLARLSEAATFANMKRRSELLAPDGLGVLKDTSAFFRRGTSGAGAEILDEADLDRYRRRTEELAAADLLSWLHRQ